MSSIIEGYNYDIFISYRQKDNKGDRWVTKFVENLRAELESTFKEDVSIYFDENPHDRLQETHNVNKSLEDKLKCLIFIPVLSQTYCDPNSFAWQYEFLPFIKMAENDSFGKDVKLRSGNVSSRILPVRIHDLEQEDIKLFEKEAGSVMRALDFVFKTSSGVNRPLSSNEDHPNDNLNKTFYRDQINKSANAIKEIILGLKTEATGHSKDEPEYKPDKAEIKKENTISKQRESVKPVRSRFLSAAVVTSIIVIAGILIVTRIYHFGINKVARDPDGRISIAVNDFNNNSSDTSLNNLKIAIPDLIRNNLASNRESGELVVQNSQTIYELYQSMGLNQQASILPSVSREAAKRLKAGTYLTGSFQSIGDSIIILSELNDTQSGEVLWSRNIKGLKEKYPYLAFSLSGQLKNFLEIKVLKQQVNPEFGEAFTNSPEAYRKYIDGMQFMIKMNWFAALQSFKDAYGIDTTFSLAAFYTAYLYCYNNYDFVQIANWTQKAYNVREKLPYDYKRWIEMWETCSFIRNLDDIIKSCDLLELSDNRSRYFWWDLGVTYEDCEVYDKAVKAFEKVEKITHEWGDDWKYPDYYWRFGWALHNIGLHEKEAAVCDKGLTLFPDNGGLIYCQAVCAISKGDTLLEGKLLIKLLKMARDSKTAECDIEKSLGDIYSDANSIDIAEKHYRNALKLDPNNYIRKNALALFLIRNDRQVDEADSLSKEVLRTKPESPAALWIQGLINYKHGKYKESLELIQHSKDLVKLSWNTTKDKDIKKVREALARQN